MEVGARGEAVAEMRRRCVWRRTRRELGREEREVGKGGGRHMKSKVHGG